jgi:hypothetical protein
MNILDRLWDVYRSVPFTIFLIQCKLDLRPQELTEILRLFRSENPRYAGLSDFSDSSKVRDGYILKKT